ncbi:hypothetical protein DVK52_21870 [Escherichia coli]|nr:hypothetical protein [Escherichia coli]RCA55790.1 hypothetical protein C6A54_24995 [Escherichia coli]RCZ83260.1 hypothetical protein DTM13_24930 [Escherichia coli]
MTSLKTSIKTITYLSDTGCLEIQGASLCASIASANKCRMRLMIYRPKKKCFTYSNPPDKSQTRYHRSRLYSSDTALSL